MSTVSALFTNTDVASSLQRLVVRQHVRMTLTRIVHGTSIGVSITELAVPRGAVLTESLAISVGWMLRSCGARVDHIMMRMGWDHLVFALSTQGFLFLKIKWFYFDSLLFLRMFNF